MFKVLKPLIDSSIISEETVKEIMEAWETQLSEATETVKSELREEFAQRYEHDKTHLVEALDSMVTDSLTKEISEFVEDKKAVVEQAVAYRSAISTHAEKLDDFVTNNLIKEMTEFRGERGNQSKSFVKLEKFVIKALGEEIAEFNGDKKDLVETKARLIRQSKSKLNLLESQFKKRSVKLDRFINNALHEEIAEFNEDKKDLVETKVRLIRQSKSKLNLLESQFNARSNKLERFINEALREELTEFNEDKQDVIKTKVRLVENAKTKLAELKTQFIKRSAKLVERTVTNTIRDELTQLKEDITRARKNQFGREIFEAFAAEYTTSHLNEGTEVAKLQKVNSAFAEQIAEADNKLSEKEALITSQESQIRIVEDRSARNDIMTEILAPLAKAKRVVMSDLLENVKTINLKTSFNKYLPSVLNETVQRKVRKLNESKKSSRKVMTGDRKPAVKEAKSASLAPDEVETVLNLAGLDK